MPAAAFAPRLNVFQVPDIKVDERYWIGYLGFPNMRWDEVSVKVDDNVNAVKNAATSLSKNQLLLVSINSDMI